jgi:hypothetical protein
MFRKFKDYFIPHEGNSYAPHSLQKAAMFGMLFLVILSFTATNALSLLWISSQWMVGTVLPAVIVSLTNEERGNNSLGTLKHNSVLDAAATLKAQDMAKNSYFAHYSPTGVSPWHWFGEAKYNFVHAGENLAIHFSDSDAVMDAWMQSPTHRANIVNGKYTEIGVGTAKGTYEGFPTVYVVQLFGTPAAPAPVEKKPEVAPTPVKVVPEVKPETPTEPALAQASTTQDRNEVLAEAVSITEQVTVVKAKPVASVVKKVDPSKPLTNTASVTPTSTLALVASAEATTSPSSTTPIRMEATDAGVALYTDFISTSTGGIPATVSSVSGEKVNNPPFFLSLATQPHKVLQILYVVIGLFVLCSLLLSILIEIRQQQPLQIAYSVGLMSLMMVLFYAHTILSTGALIL